MKKPFFTSLFSFTLVALGAQNWQPMAARLLPNGYVIFSVSAVGENVVWAVASQEYYQAPIPGTYFLKIETEGKAGVAKVIKN